MTRTLIQPVHRPILEWWWWETGWLFLPVGICWTRLPSGYWGRDGQQNRQARFAVFDRPRLSSRNCAAVKVEPQVPHRQLVIALVSTLGPSLVGRSWFARTAKTNSPPQSEHSRFCIALAQKIGLNPTRPMNCSHTKESRAFRGRSAFGFRTVQVPTNSNQLGANPHGY